MKSLTYGTLPTKKEFTEQFNKECPLGYNILLNDMDSRAVEGYIIGDGNYGCDELWDGINEIVNNPPAHEVQFERALDLVSSILFTLNFEWI